MHWVPRQSGHLASQTGALQWADDLSHAQMADESLGGSALGIAQPRSGPNSLRRLRIVPEMHAAVLVLEQIGQLDHVRPTDVSFTVGVTMPGFKRSGETPSRVEAVLGSPVSGYVAKTQTIRSKRRT